MNYDMMPAGRKMDELVAEKVMGWHIGKRYQLGILAHFPGDYDCWLDDNDEVMWWCPFEPSSKIDPAWKVVEKLVSMERYIELHIFSDGSGVSCEIYEDRADKYPGGKDYPGSTWEPAGYSQADTTPLAICRAMLKAAENF